MNLSVKRLGRIFMAAAKDWSRDKSPRLGASLAFYTLFSLSPLIVITITIASLWFSHKAENQGKASDQIFQQIGGLIGEDNAHSLQRMLVQPNQKKQGVFATVAASVMLLVGATGVFIQLQDAFNEIWEVQSKPGQGIKGFIRHRLLSIAMVLGIGFLLLVSLILTAGMAAFGKYMSGHFGNLEWLWQILNNVISFGVVALLFAMMFKYLPDVKVSWHDVWVGAFITAMLFTIGKYLLGMYIGKSSLVSTYAAAGSLIVVLLWVYYSSQILFFGAELTQAFAYEAGRKVQPTANAEWDPVKKCAAAEQEKQEERRKKEKEQKEAEKDHPQTAPVPAYTMAHAGAPAGVEQGGARKRFSRTALGSVAFFALIVVPFERWARKQTKL
jgi:membrane protein